MRTRLEKARQQLHRALASGADTTTLRAELRLFEAEAARIVVDDKRAAQAAADITAARIRAEAERIVGDADERQRTLLARFDIENI
ncbi:HlyD family efflux transporter periplasmic adaptor subunit [Paraburkholderia sp. D1E]|uniref:HlyD family efflux transporter periplasmic adaptor subunit n=1 Tax=Paraburkholderia sp. D1E TaxID=3461398 RepID=UPI004045731C